MNNIIKDSLAALYRLENDALNSRDGYGYSSGDAETIRRAIYENESLRKENEELRSDNERMKKTGIFLNDWTLKHETLEKYCSIKDAIEQGSKCGDSFIETLTKCAIRMLELKSKLEKAKDALRFYADKESYITEFQKETDGSDFISTPIIIDYGQSARTTLEEIK